MSTISAPNPSPPKQPPRYRNAAEWLHDLGDVPLERIVFDPWPGTATEADVLRLDDHEDRLCELIDGTLVEKGMGYDESLIAVQIIFLLKSWVSPRKLGLVSGADGMMRIMKGRVRIPDVAFVSTAQFPKGKRPKGPIPSLAPDLAVEVLSASNTAREMEIKLDEYFRSGTRLVWIVDPKTRSVNVYTSAKKFSQLTEADTLDGGTVLRGMKIPVAQIFDV